MTSYALTAWEAKLCFNPHAREGRDVFQTVTKIGDAVSIHTPARGVTCPGLPGASAGTVSIHTPARGVTRAVSLFQGPGRVSIHTPARGVTQRALEISLREVKFQSTRPRGA